MTDHADTDTARELRCGSPPNDPRLPGMPEPSLARSWTVLVTSGGTAPVETLAAAAGYTRQHLARLFREEYGVSPKRASRIVRLSRARQVLTSGSATTLAEVAAACGYYDEAHLRRDAREFADCSPGQLTGPEDPVTSVGSARGQQR